MRIGRAPNRRRRVVVTGIGIVAPNGIGKATFWDKLLAGESAVSLITAFDASSYRTQIAAEVKGFTPADYIPSARGSRMWRFSQFAVASALLAIDDAKLDVTRPGLADRVAVYAGSSVNGIGTAERMHTEFLVKGPSRVLAETVIDCGPHAPATYVSAELRITGPTASISTDCCTGLDIIYAGYSQIVSGRADVVLAGACEAPIFPMTFAAFSELGILSTRNNEPTRASRPFDRHRDGIVLGEGGAYVILEDLEFAEARGAHIYAEISGYGSTQTPDLLDLAASTQTLAEAIRTALDAAQLHPSEIDHINAHGNSLSHHDICDTNAFKAVFNGDAYNIPITSIKSMLGQPIAVSGILQLAAACLTIENSIVSPTINLDEADPSCDLDYVPNYARACRADNVLIDSHGMAGNFAALVIRKPAT